MSRQAFLSETENKLFPFVALEIQICGSLLKYHARRPGAGVAQRQFGELEDRAGSKTQAAAVFELDFSARALSGAQFRALGDRQVDESFFVALSQVAVNLNIPIDLAQPHDASL